MCAIFSNCLNQVYSLLSDLKNNFVSYLAMIILLNISNLKILKIFLETFDWYYIIHERSKLSTYQSK